MNLWKKKSGDNGSASVEAVLTVPVFLFAMTAFISIFNMIALKGVIYEAAIETAEYMAEYAYLAEKYPQGAEVGTGIYASKKLNEYLDDPDMAERYVENGTNGISLLGSRFPDEDGYIVLRVKYRTALNIPFICSLTKDYEENIRQKAYLGYKKKENGSTETEEVYVYVAENGTVYHSSRLCSYLAPDIRVSAKEAVSARGYGPCEYCGEAAGNTVYITGEGQRYHSTQNCSRLRRTVYRKKLSETGGMPPCQRCH